MSILISIQNQILQVILKRQYFKKFLKTNP